MTDAPAHTKTTTLTRLYDAPASLVFDCCLKPEHLVHWYNAGDGWTTPSAETDPRPGGRFNIRFQGPDPKIGFDLTGTYNEIVPPAPGKSGRIKYTLDDGRPVWMEMLEKDGKTYLTLILTLENTHSEEQQRHGWGAMLDNLNTYLERTAS